jgi:hypothetical protein
MTDLTSQEQSNKDENIDQSIEVLEEYDDTSSGSNAETIALTVFAIIIMGILIFLFI